MIFFVTKAINNYSLKKVNILIEVERVQEDYIL